MRDASIKPTARLADVAATVRLHPPRRERVVQHDTRHLPLAAGA